MSISFLLEREYKASGGVTSPLLLVGFLLLFRLDDMIFGKIMEDDVGWNAQQHGSRNNNAEAMAIMDGVMVYLDGGIGVFAFITDAVAHFEDSIFRW